LARKQSEFVWLISVKFGSTFLFWAGLIGDL